MKYILEGNDNEVAKIVRENRIRVERGLVTLTPLDEETSEDFIDDDPNDMPDDDDSGNHQEDFFNDGEENEPSPEVKKILLEPLKGESDESTIVTDNKNVEVSDNKKPSDKKKPKRGQKHK